MYRRDGPGDVHGDKARKKDEMKRLKKKKCEKTRRARDEEDIQIERSEQGEEEEAKTNLCNEKWEMRMYILK